MFVLGNRTALHVELMTRLNPIILLFAILICWSLDAFAWNIPTHMITGAIAHRLLEGTEPGKAGAIEAIMKQHPRYSDGWRNSLEKFPESQRGEMLFMLAARWADDIRPQDASETGATEMLLKSFLTILDECLGRFDYSGVSNLIRFSGQPW